MKPFAPVALAALFAASLASLGLVQALEASHGDQLPLLSNTPKAAAALRNRALLAAEAETGVEQDAERSGPATRGEDDDDDGGDGGDEGAAVMPADPAPGAPSATPPDNGLFKGRARPQVQQQ